MERYAFDKSYIIVPSDTEERERIVVEIQRYVDVWRSSVDEIGIKWLRSPLYNRKKKVILHNLLITFIFFINL